MDCAKAYRYICDNLDAKLDSPRCRRIRQHLDDCPECRAYLASIKTTVRLFQAVPRVRVPASTHRKLMRTLERELPARQRRACRKPARPRT
jgi:anti-sigma factor RsiW